MNAHENTAPATADATPSYEQRMLSAACEALGAVDDALGLPADGCNNPNATLQRIALVKQFMSADSAAELRRAVRAMAAMLDNGEWAEHVSTDRDAQDLESAITDLVGDHSAMHDALRQIASGDAQDARALAQQTLAELATDALEAESSLAVVERPGCIPVAELRRYFEASVAQTPPLALRFPLTPVAESVFGRYVDGATNTLWLGFSIGMRCAERVAAAQQPAGTTPRVDALMQQWGDDGATRGAAFCALHDLARELEAAQQPAEPINAELLETLQAMELLFAPLARDSTAATWIDKARALIAKVKSAAVEIPRSQQQAQVPTQQPARQPLTRQQIDDLTTHHFPLDSLLTENVDRIEAFVRDAEKLLGITETNHG